MSAFTTLSETESEQEVTLEDQQKINLFGKLNSRIVEVKADMEQGTIDLQKFNDAVGDLEMLIDGSASILVGESFVEVDEDTASEFLTNKIKNLEDKLETYKKEISDIESEQAVLKKELYAKFGDSINLEN